MPKITKNSMDETIKYDVLQTPDHINLSNVIKIDEHVFEDNYKFIHCYVSMSDIKQYGLPIDANPREPSRVSVVNQMINTIRDNPDKFHHWNNGISLVCTKLNYNKDTQVLHVEFNEGDGICNGGHTYFAIVKAAKPKCTLAWAALIRLVYEVDPLLCPKCGAQMKIISFINQNDVIEKILRHCGLWNATVARPPPSVILAA
jgi:hypothetical protein